jgi:hypothetical protein
VKLATKPNTPGQIKKGTTTRTKGVSSKTCWRRVSSIAILEFQARTGLEIQYTPFEPMGGVFALYTTFARRFDDAAPFSVRAPGFLW